MIRLDITETEFTEKVTTYMAPYFDIQAEVWSDSGKYRVDYVYTLKGAEDVKFAVECKRPDDKKGGGDSGIGAVIIQCMKYSVETWSGKRLPVFIAPDISANYIGYIKERINRNTYVDRHNSDMKHHVVNGMLGHLNVGEIRRMRHEDYKKDYYIFSFSNQEIFSTKKKWMSNEVIGLHRINYEKLLKSINQWKFL